MHHLHPRLISSSVRCGGVRGEFGVSVSAGSRGLNHMPNSSNSDFTWLGGAIFAAVVSGWLGAQLVDQNHAPIVGALTWTGRLAFAVFLVPLFASPLRTLIKHSFTTFLMRWRRRAGIAFGGIQAVHVVLVASMFVTLDDPPVETLMVIVGATGLVLALAMLVTSFPGPTRALGRKLWKILHRSGFYVFMVIYFYDFVLEPMLIDRVDEYWSMALLTVAGMAVRVVAAFRSPSGAPARV